MSRARWPRTHHDFRPLLGTFSSYSAGAPVSHLQRLDVFAGKRLKQMKALLWNGMVVVAVDASGVPPPTDVYLGKGALSQTRRKLDDEGNVLENNVCYSLLRNLYTVRKSG